MSKAMGSSSSTPWSSTYEEIKNKHDLAYVSIEEAISLEENEKSHEAIESYKRGIQLIDEALSIQVTCPDHPDFTWEKACVMIQKLKKTRAEVLMRINSIQSSEEFIPNIPTENPPSYEEAVASSPSSDSSGPQTYKDLAVALSQLSLDRNVDLAEAVIYTHDNVRLYFISPSGEVVSSLQPQTLRISMVEGEQENTPKYILQIGDWVYPLVPGVSPCYRTSYGAFILPDVYSSESGASIGIILPSDADAQVFDLLENILHGIVGYPIEKELRKKKEPEAVSTKISKGLVNGAWYVSQGLIRGAEKAGELISSGTPKLISQMDTTTDPKPLPRKVCKGIEIAENATHKAAVVTGFVADRVGEATMKLGQFLAPHIQKQGTRLLTTGFRMSEEEASDKVKGVLTVAAGAVEGFSTVYRGLESAASILGNNLKNNTVKVVNHKYGAPAGQFTDQTLMTVGNVYTITRNTKCITPKGLAKQTVADTGKAVAYSYNTVQEDGASTSQQSQSLRLHYRSENDMDTSNNVDEKKDKNEKQ